MVNLVSLNLLGGKQRRQLFLPIQYSIIIPGKYKRLSFFLLSNLFDCCISCSFIFDRLKALELFHFQITNIFCSIKLGRISSKSNLKFFIIHDVIRSRTIEIMLQRLHIFLFCLLYCEAYLDSYLCTM